MTIPTSYHTKTTKNKELAIEFQSWKGQKCYQVEREIQLTTQKGIKKYTQTFDALLVYIAQEKRQHTLLYQQENTRLNHKEPDTLIANMTLLVQNNLYPYKFLINESGEMEGIANYSSIQNHFKNAVKELKQQYQGEAVEMVIDMFQHALATQEQLEQSLAHDLFYTTLFQPIYQSYGKTGIITDHVFTFPLFSLKQTVTTNGTLTLDQADKNHITVQYKGYETIDLEQQKRLSHTLRINDTVETPLQVAVNFTVQQNQQYPFSQKELQLTLTQGDQIVYKEKIQIRFKALKIERKTSNKMRFFVDEKE